MSDLMIITFGVVTLSSILGGFFRWFYPGINETVANDMLPVNLRVTLVSSAIVGLCLSTYFYTGLSGSNVEIQFIYQLGLLALVLVFRNVDRLNQVKLNKII